MGLPIYENYTLAHRFLCFRILPQEKTWHFFRRINFFIHIYFLGVLGERRELDVYQFLEGKHFSSTEIVSRIQFQFQFRFDRSIVNQLV